MEQNTQITVTLLANEGILIYFNETKMLVDGIHENTTGMFSGLSKQVLADLLEGKIPLFQNIDYLLFTHCHQDHFTAWCTESFLQNHRVKGLFLPDRPTSNYISLRQTAMCQADQKWFLDLPLAEKKAIKLTDDISITIFRSKHAGKQFASIENYCYLLDFSGKTVFIVADGDYDAHYYAQMLVDSTIDAAFVNPLFLNLAEGREVITQALKPKRLIVYHIPFADRDTGFRRLVTCDIEKYRSNLPPVDILWNELQQVLF